MVKRRKKVKRPKKRVVKKKRRIVRNKRIVVSKIRPVNKGANMGKVFLGLLFLLVSIYLFITQTSTSTLIFGGGVIALLGILTLVKAFKR